jgi:hypothetical protein
MGTIWIIFDNVLGANNLWPVDTSSETNSNRWLPLPGLCEHHIWKDWTYEETPTWAEVLRWVQLTQTALTRNCVRALLI